MAVLQMQCSTRIRKGLGAEALNRALCVVLQKLGYAGVRMEGDDHPPQRGGGGG